MNEQNSNSSNNRERVDKGACVTKFKMQMLHCHTNDGIFCNIFMTELKFNLNRDIK